MLSGEGNAGERRKTTTSLISKKSNFARAAHFFCTFLCRCFARLLTTLNFQKLLRYPFNGGNVERVLVHFFFTARTHFHLALVTAIISYFVTTATKFSCCSSNKNVSFVFYLSLYISELGIFTGSRAVDGKEMYKKAWCTCKVVVLPCQATAYLTFCRRRILNFLLFTIHCDPSKTEYSRGKVNCFC